MKRGLRTIVYDDTIPEEQSYESVMPSQAPAMDNYMPEFPGMEDPSLRQVELADGGVVQREGFANAGLVQVKHPSVKKLKNPPNPKKPFVYRSPDGAQHFATKEEALDAMKQRKIQQYKAREKPLKQSEINKVREFLSQGKSYPEIVKETGIVYGRVQKASKALGFKYQSYVDNPSNREFVKENYGKLSRSTIGKTLFPNVSADVQYDRAGKIIQSMITGKEIKPIPAALVLENREKLNYNPDIQDAKVKAKRRKLIKQVSDYNKELQLANLKKGFNVDLAHRLSLAQTKKVNELYNLSNLGIDTPKINREFVKPYENKLKDLYTQQNKLVRRAKKLGKVTDDITKGLSNINEEISDLFFKTNGRIQGIHIDEYNLKPKTTHIDYTKVLGMGVIDPKVKNITKQDLALVSEMLPSQIAKEQALEKKISELETIDTRAGEEKIKTIVENIGCPTGSLKAANGANCYIKGAEKIQAGKLNQNEFNVLQKAVKSPAVAKAVKYGGVALKGLGALFAPLMVYDTYTEYKKGKPISEALEYGLLGTNIIGGTRDELKLTPREREARGVQQQYEREQQDVSGLSSDFYFPSDLSVDQAAKIYKQGQDRVAAERAAEEKQAALENVYQGDPGILDYSEYAYGGRVGLEKGSDPKDKPIIPMNPMMDEGPQDPSKRTFIQGAGGVGLAGLLLGTGLLKLGKSVAVPSKIGSMIKNTTAPSWMEALITKVMKEGKDLSKKEPGTYIDRSTYSTVSKDKILVKELEFKNPDTGKMEIIRLRADEPRDTIYVDYIGDNTLAGQGVTFKLSPKEKIVNSKDGKYLTSEKVKGEYQFSAHEAEPRVVNWDGDIEFDGETGVRTIIDLNSDISGLKSFVTGGKGVDKKVAKIKRETVDKIEKNPAEYIEDTYDANYYDPSLPD